MHVLMHEDNSFSTKPPTWYNTLQNNFNFVLLTYIFLSNILYYFNILNFNSFGTKLPILQSLKLIWSIKNWNQNWAFRPCCTHTNPPEMVLMTPESRKKQITQLHNLELSFSFHHTIPGAVSILDLWESWS